MKLPRNDNVKRELKCINPKAHQAQKIYDSNGLATTLSANGGGQGGKTGLYKVDLIVKRT